MRRSRRSGASALALWLQVFRGSAPLGNNYSERRRRRAFEEDESAHPDNGDDDDNDDDDEEEDEEEEEEEEDSDGDDQNEENPWLAQDGELAEEGGDGDEGSSDDESDEDSDNRNQLGSKAADWKSNLLLKVSADPNKRHFSIAAGARVVSISRMYVVGGRSLQADRKPCRARVRRAK